MKFQNPNFIQNLRISRICARNKGSEKKIKSPEMFTEMYVKTSSYEMTRQHNNSTKFKENHYLLKIVKKDYD